MIIQPTLAMIENAAEWQTVLFVQTFDSAAQLAAEIAQLKIDYAGELAAGTHSIVHSQIGGAP